MVFSYWDKIREINGVVCCKPAFPDLFKLKELKNSQVVVERFSSLQTSIAGNLMVNYLLLASTDDQQSLYI